MGRWEIASGFRVFKFPDAGFPACGERDALPPPRGEKWRNCHNLAPSGQRKQLTRSAYKRNCHTSQNTRLGMKRYLIFAALGPLLGGFWLLLTTTELSGYWSHPASAAEGAKLVPV